MLPSGRYFNYLNNLQLKAQNEFNKHQLIFPHLILQPTNEGIIQNETSENCLYLSVYTPNMRKSKGPLLPVLVWIHGGSFVYGCGMFPISGPEIFMKVCLLLQCIDELSAIKCIKIIF